MALCSDGAYLRVLSDGSATDAVTVIEVPHAGEYWVWTRSRDYAHEEPGTRRYQLIINDQPVEKESGNHGQDGFYWESVGRVKLPEGEAVLRIHDVTRKFARSDAILLTTLPDFDPNSEALDRLEAYRIHPKMITVNPPAPLAEGAPPDLKGLWTESAQLESKELRMTFLTGRDMQGKPRVIRRTALWVNGQWIDIPADAAAERLYLIHSQKREISFGKIIPSWRSPAGGSTFQAAGKTHNVYQDSDATNPFYAGDSTLCTPRAVVRQEGGVVEIRYETESGKSITGRWSLGAGGSDARVDFDFTVQAPGYYSFGFCAFQGWARADVDLVQLSPLYKYQALPDAATLLPIAITPQPMAIVQPAVRVLPLGISFFISAEPEKIPVNWGSGFASIYGFSLLNAEGRVQPVAFSPILGNPSSQIKKDGKVRASFRIGAVPGDWRQAMEYASASVMKVDDYRRQNKVSLSDAALNMFDLLRDPVACGWDANLKGFYDIEANPKVAPTVAQSAPLMLLSAAVLANDEKLYRERALPTIEYTLSRVAFRFSDHAGTPFFATPDSLKLEAFSPIYNTAYYQGLDALLGRVNPWIEKLAVPNGDLRPEAAFGARIPRWSQWLAAYRFQSNPAYLKKAVEGANEFVCKQIYIKDNKPLAVQPFYNVSYPYWWDLLDLYELTSDRSYLDAAEDAAFQTVAGQRSHPLVSDQPITINNSDKERKSYTVWWRGKEKFRLGFPVPEGALPPKEVPQSDVSPVGLGFEQVMTYFNATTGVKQVLMSAWAPSLLRLYTYTGRDIFRVYARNSIIGRFGNYPGYYATQFNDIYRNGDYPFKGPDLTYIYYHHAPGHLAFTVDYLMTEAEQRSAGRIHFPWVKQEGFVWFTNRIFGSQPGTIFDDPNAKLLFDRSLVKVNSPEINTLTARSAGRFWVILMNESKQEERVDVTLDKSAGVAEDASGKLMSAQGVPSDLRLKNATASIVIPAQGLVAVSLPSSTNSLAATLPPVKDGYRKWELGGDWGMLHAFRIRSPFGKDSLYLFLTGNPVGGKVTIQLDQPEKRTVTLTKFPYEWSLYPIAMNQSIRFTVIAETPDGKKLGQAFEILGDATK